MRSVKNHQKRILIIHTWGIGDMILLTPALRVAKKMHPELKITLLVLPHAAALPVQNASHVDEIIFGGWKPRELIASLRNLRKEKYHAAFFSSGVTAWKTWLFLLFIKAKHKISEYNRFKLPCLTDYVPRKPQLSRARSNYELLATAIELPKWEEALQKREELDFATDFTLSEENLEWAANYIKTQQLGSKNILAIHPGCMASNSFRRWPVEYFATLIESVKKDFDLNIVVIAGPDEEEEGRYLSQIEGVKLLERSSLGNVAAFISLCDVFVNTDSGLGHIASCFQIPSLTIFGPGDENQTAPFSPKSELIRLEIDCAPCVRNKKRNCNAECLLGLSPQMVYDSLKPILEKL